MCGNFLMATLILAVATSTTFAGPGERPNVVVIVADDLGYADVGFQGCKDIPTPHLDGLARSGIICTNGYVSHPFCAPSRAGLLTGRYQQRFGFEHNPPWLPEDPNVGLPLDQTTVAEVMREAGYVTGAIGKWHLGADPVFHPDRRGFDSYFGLLGGSHSYFDMNEFWRNPNLATIDLFSPILRDETPVPVYGYLTDALGREAVNFIHAHRHEPFFLYLAFNAPHGPLEAPKKYLERVRGIADPERRTYGAMVSGMDDAIGAVMTRLAEAQLLRNTLVIFFSDNGGPIAGIHAQNTPLRGAKGQVYEGGIRVPFVVSWPDRLSPGKFNEAVSSLDVFPTVAALAGVTSPSPQPLDGVDLLPSLLGEGPGALKDRALFWRTGGGESLAIRRGEFKLVQVRQRRIELYDLSTDISEARDLAKSRPQTLSALKKELAAWDATLVSPKW
jgi:arylsulfatase A-like enzyme